MLPAKSTVTILDKKKGETWSKAEVSAITNAMAEVQQITALPHRVAVMNKPLQNTIEGALGHTNYTSRDVDYRDRWNED